jgi:hypothetical protein
MPLISAVFDSEEVVLNEIKINIPVKAFPKSLIINSINIML